MFCSWIISRVTTVISIHGITALIESSPLADSSVAPPTSILNPAGKVSRTGESRRSICAATTGACTWSRKSARTVMVGKRLRRTIRPSSSTGFNFATCASGT